MHSPSYKKVFEFIIRGNKSSMMDRFVASSSLAICKKAELDFRHKNSKSHRHINIHSIQQHYVRFYAGFLDAKNSVKYEIAFERAKA